MLPNNNQSVSLIINVIVISKKDKHIYICMYSNNLILLYSESLNFYFLVLRYSEPKFLFFFYCNILYEDDFSRFLLQFPKFIAKPWKAE